MTALSSPHFEALKKIEPDLRNLLPAELYAEIYVADWADQDAAVSAADADKKDGEKIKTVFDHLASLQKILSDYTSSLITEKRDDKARLQAFKRNGALMFTDLAGFTKLMEANAVKGNEGASDLLRVFNGYFTDIIEVVIKSGGELLEFTGDALLILFASPLSADEGAARASLQKSIAKAVRAGLRMQRAMEKYKAIETPSGSIELKMRIGIHAGHFYSADIGTPRRREHVLLGRNVQLAKLTESKGQNGAVNLSPEAYAYIQNDFRFESNPLHAGYMLAQDDFGNDLSDYEMMAKSTTRRLASAVLYEKNFAATYEAVQRLLDVIKELASFIPSPVLNLLVESAAKRRIIPEFPTPIVMFVNFIGLPEMIDKGIFQEESVIARFNETFARLNAAVEKRGGVLKKVTYHLTGSDIVVYFGVPTAHTNDAMRAASAALDIREIIMKTGLPALKPGCEDPEAGAADRIYCKIGINFGPTFVAEIGDPRGRREFNVLGDTVNTTARLMSKADKNQIYISKAVMEQIQEKYQCEFVGDVQLKGKGAAMSIYQLTAQK